MHHTAYFNGEEGQDVELHCVYKSFPAPSQVKWMRGGSQIFEDEKYAITSDVKEHHDRTKLLVRNVDSKKDLVTYQCVVEVSFVI
jgi:hypothetical protein